MYDIKVRSIVSPVFELMAKIISQKTGLTPNNLTWIAFGFSVLSVPAVAMGSTFLGFIIFGIGRVFDALDGDLARIKVGYCEEKNAYKRDFGSYLDIVLDFASYSLFVFGFVILDPSRYGIAGGFLACSFVATGLSYLGYSIFAEKRRISQTALSRYTERVGGRSYAYIAGLTEAGETILCFLLISLFSDWFNAFAIIFGLMCCYTAYQRLRIAHKIFSKPYGQEFTVETIYTVTNDDNSSHR